MELTVKNRTIVRIVLIVLGILLALRLIEALKTQIIWILTAFFLTLAVEPAVDWLSRRLPRRSRALAITIVMLAVLAIIAFVLIGLIPPFAGQFYHLVTNLPDAYNGFMKDNPRIADLVNSYAKTTDIGAAIQQFFKQLLTFGGSAAGIISGIFGGLLALVTILIMSIFMVLEGPRWIELFWKYQPAKRREKWRELLRQMHRTVTGYVGGNLFTSLIAAVASTIMLLIVGSPYAFSLGLLVGMVDLIPMVGATLAAVLVCLVVLVFKSFGAAVVMAIFFVIYQQVENHVLQPLVFSKAVQISPLVTIVALTVGASLAGFVGALVAIPVAASIQILIRYHFENNNKKQQAT